MADILILKRMDEEKVQTIKFRLLSEATKVEVVSITRRS